jgi:hypothetical protein
MEVGYSNSIKTPHHYFLGYPQEFPHLASSSTMEQDENEIRKWKKLALLLNIPGFLWQHYPYSQVFSQPNPDPAKRHWYYYFSRFF